MVLYSVWHTTRALTNRTILVSYEKDMKLTVTREQIRAALENLYRTDVEDFTIIPSKPSAIGMRCRSVVSMADLEENRIRNIKALRNLSIALRQRMTLMEGMWAIDNWQRFIEFVDEYNRLPLGGYGSTETKGVLK